MLAKRIQFGVALAVLGVIAIPKFAPRALHAESNQVRPPAAVSGAPEGGAGLVLVVHRSNPLPSISIIQLRKLLLSDPAVVKGPQDWMIALLRNPGGPLRSGIEYALKMPVTQYHRQRRAAAYRGEMLLPLEEFDTQEAVCRFIAERPNAFAILESTVAASYPDLKLIPISLSRDLSQRRD